MPFTKIGRFVVTLIALLGSTLYANETVRDEFSSRSYSNNDGTVNWSGDWIENDYYGATGGNIQVYGNQLYVHGKTTNSNPAYQPRIERQVNLDGASSAILSLDWKGGRGFESADKLFIDASSDGGAHWTTIHTLTGPEAERATGSITEDITPYASANTRIRFRVIDTRGSSEYFYLDNVQISYTTVPPVSAGELKGKVYLDSNADGEKTGESGQADVIVTVYDDAGVAVATATTDANGEYEISGLDDALKYRLEFTNIPTNLNPGPSGTNNYTTTVFVQSPQADVDLGLTDSSGFCQANPTVATPGYANGNPLGGGSTSSKTSLYLFPYKASGTSGFSTGATQTQTGSTWGLAYQKESKKLFSSAVLKRHTGVGSGGLGAIYLRDMNSGTTSLFTDVTALGVDVGTIASNGSRGLPSGTRTPSNDPEAFGKIAKVGIGDIDLSEDGGTLYMTNLNERQIYAIPVGNPATTPTTASALPNQPWLEAGACTDGLGRPWGLKNHGGKLYVGVVCTGEFADDNIKNVPAPSSLRGRVYAYDPVAQTWAMPMDFPLDYKKGQTSTVRHNNEDTYWLTWTDRYINDTNHGHGTASGVTYMEDSTRTTRPMPILSDIEFDKTGAMILGFMDRGGLMFGNGNYPPTGTSPLHQYNVSGDLLRACPNGAGWTLESGGACGGITAGGANAEGPGGGEYYTGDNFKIHKETIMGGIAQHPATDEITVVTMDPLKSVDAGGVRWISNTTGKDTRGLQLYQGRPNNPSNGTFGKGVGLGDVEILCDPAPLEIGNYVWVDTDADGIQDPNEAPIANVTLELWDNGVKVGETQTDAKGEYYFGGASDKGMLGGNHLLPYHDYEIRLPLNDLDIPANHVPTVMDQGTDVHDSDGDNGGIHSGYSTIKLTTGKAGENDHTFDFGFTPPVFDLALKKVLAVGQATTINAGDKVKFTITVYNQGTANAFDVDVQDYIPTDTSYSASGSTADATVLTTTNGNSATLTNNGDGTFEISELTAGDDVSFDIELDVSPSFAGTSIRNWAEISDGSLTDGGGTATDIDSTPDSINFNQPGETNDLDDDNVIDQDGKNNGDEDDHDPAEVTVIPAQFDLALKKVLANGQANVVNAGDVVTFTITVYNQGGVQAYDIDIKDYIPADMTYSAAGSTDTNVYPTANGDLTGITNNDDGTFTIDQLAGGDNVSFDIALKIADGFVGTTIRNWAEISDASDTDGGGTATDIDSTPDTDPFTGAGETDDLNDDNVIDQDGKNGGDEDDHDPAEVSVNQSFDLALKKVLKTATVVNPGDTAIFTITVYNQGTLDGYDIDIKDYIPTDMTYDANGSTVSGVVATSGGNARLFTNNGDGTFSIDRLNAGQNISFDIALKVNSTFKGITIRNWAEISDGSDAAGGPTATDVDSTPDSTLFNGAGETDDMNDDNVTDQDGKSGGDEDDHDPAEVTVTQIFDLALMKTLAAGQADTIVAGETVKFTITVYNQGTSDAFDVNIMDYIPADATYTANGSTATGTISTVGGADTNLTNNGDGTFVLSSLPSGDSVQIDIALKVNGTFAGQSIINWAEISAANDKNGPATDIDSTPDTTQFNGGGETNDLDDDDTVNEDGKNGGDEDDHDPALVHVTPKPVSIGSYVWEDTNKDGLQGMGEPAVTGAVLELIDAVTGQIALDRNNAPIAPQTTGADGYYIFDDLLQGNYKVRITVPPIYKKTPIQTGADDNDTENDSNIKTDVNATTYESGMFTLIPDSEPVETNNEKGDDQDESPAAIADDASGNMTVDFGFIKLVPNIQIIKKTNGESADAVPGPTITVGDAITWTYEVSNTGEVPLTAVTVTDDKVTAANISCPVDNNDNVIDALAVGATVTCTATGTATAGQYVNNGSVTGIPPSPQLPPPTDNNESHYFGGSSSIDIEKSTNNEDADVKPGPTITVGDPITWTYVVTNTGNVNLTAVTVTDDKVAATDIDCGAGNNVIASLAAGANATCTATSIAVAGQYENTASVTGTPPSGPPPSDNDKSHYFGGSSSIDIEKATNGQDADVTPGPTINVGDIVTWTYRVENTGNVALSNVTVTDDKVAATDIDCGAGNNVIASLAAGANATCTATSIAVAGQYENTASVTGTPPSGPPPSDNDKSHYFGGSSSIDIEKSTNGDDADATPGPTINVGDVVTWTYRVENTGNVALSNVTVTDDKVAAADISCPVDDNDNVIASMAAGQVILCTAKGIATEGQYTNQASVTGTPPSGTPPTDNDPSHYFGGSSSIDIEKSTNGEDADVTPGPTISVGDTVTWSYKVKNTGNVILTNVMVTDDKIPDANISCPIDNGDNNISALAAGQEVICTATSIAVAGQYENTASVTGTPPSGPPPSDNDKSHYFGGSSSIDIEKSTNGDDADATPGPTINVGDVVTWTYRVENTGNVALSNVTVTDDKVAAADISCPVDDNDNVIASMAAGQVILCTAKGIATEGQYTNQASVTGTPPSGTPPTDNDPSHYFGGSSSIDIEKSTNGEDADVTPGPTISVGDTVTWTYRVENTGNVPLTEVNVTDDKVADTDIHCTVSDTDPTDNIIDTIDVGQVILCTATGVALEGQYENTATVNGIPPGSNPPPVTDDDPSHYFGGSSSIDIEKATNGEDADVTPGPTINVGDVVTWTYRVENTGNVALTDVTVTDDKVAAADIHCAIDDNDNVIGTLAAAQVVICTAASVATTGQYANTASVTGTPPTGTPPTDNDPSHYFGGSSSIDIEKSTNGTDADVTPGPTIAIDDTVTWTYLVKNTGNVLLTNVVVTDDKLPDTDISCPVDNGDNTIAALAVGQEVACTATGKAAAGQYSNIASVTGTPPTGTPPTDNDPSHYFGGSSSIDIEKSTNGADADVTPGPTIGVGDTVTWTYRVENTGNVALTDVTVTDDKVAAAEIHCAIDDNDNVIDILSPAQVVLCTATGIATTGQYANQASVTGTPPVGAPPTDSDPSHYFGGSGAVDIEKSTNGDDADSVPGPTIAVGDTVTWNYTIKNTGNVPLTGVTVTDDQLPDADISCPVDDSNNIIDALAVGQEVVCHAQGIAQANQYANTGKVSGKTPTDKIVTDDDPSHYFGAKSSIHIEKATNGEDADTAPGPKINVGDPVTWSYAVTNTGTSTLLDVLVHDDHLPDANISCPIDDSDNNISALAPGQSIICTAKGIAIPFQYANTGSVIGQPDIPNAPKVTDDDPSHYFGAEAAIDLEKSTNGKDADTGTGPTIGVGETVTWSYRVENTGNVDLQEVKVTDDRVASSQIVCPTDDGTDNTIDILTVGQVVICTASGIAKPGQYANTGSVTGKPPVGIPPSDNDPSHYFGATSSINLEKSTNGADADVTPGPTIGIGQPVTWNYKVTNTGNVALKEVTITDDKLPATDITCPGNNGTSNIITELAIGQSVVCTAKGTSVAGQYENTASVTGKPPVGAPPTDSDPSHYYGADQKIDIEKSTNGEDADTAPGPVINVGAPVTWSYKVTNTGNVRLDDVNVSDDKLPDADIVCPNNTGISNIVATLTPGQSIVCTAKGTSVADQYENNASTVGTPVDDNGIPLVNLTPPTDSDLSHYYGGSAKIDIEKSTNGKDADTGPGESIYVNEPISWTYKVKNLGNVVLTNVTVTDDKLPDANISCAGGSNIIPAMNVGQEVICVAQGVAIEGPYENNGSVTGTPPGGTPPTDSDLSHYTGIKPKMALGSTVWEDKDDNGRHDAGEPGIAGVKLKLFKAGEDPATATALQETMTNADGNYIFTNLDEGTYVVYIPTPPTNLPLSSHPTNTHDDQTDGDDNGDQPGGSGTPVHSPDIVLKANTEPLAQETEQGGNQDDLLNDYNGDMTIDFGFIKPTIIPPEPPKASLGDLVWYDDNNDGIQDPNESGVSGIKVYLLNEAGERIKDVNGVDIFTETNTTGEYLFDGLTPNKKYAVAFDLSTLPQGYRSTIQDAGSNETKDSDADPDTGMTDPIMLLPGQHYPDLDMGIYKKQTPIPLYHIGTHFWIDYDNDGAFDGGKKNIDVPIKHALVELLDGAKHKLYWTDSTKKKLTTTSTPYPAETYTSPKGEYGFDVPAGKYQVRFNIPKKLKEKGFTFGARQSGGTDQINRASEEGVTTPVEVGPGIAQRNLTLDAAVVCPCANSASDSGDALSKLSMLLILLLTLSVGLYYVLREEEQII